MKTIVVLGMHRSATSLVARSLNNEVHMGERLLTGFKDPRTCLTIDVWLPFLENPHFIVCYRSPADVARSFNNRDGVNLPFALALTNEYNTRISNFMTKWLAQNQNNGDENS
jgi:hypothetical protein